MIPSIVRTCRDIIKRAGSAGSSAAAATPPVAARRAAAPPPAGKQAPGFYRRRIGGFEVTVLTVAAWLRGLGLDQYEQVFRDNAVDADVLPDLTDTELEKLGVLLGHRKKLLKAVAGLRKPCADSEVVVLAPVRGSGTESAAPSRRPSDARSPSCSSTWSPRRCSRRASIPRT